ncbi:hypothetical protein APY03_6386 [Variovorax sp. WDL1]|nr:hypothetical protein APY03_6386 [Variovorax sp. WDL1]
MALDTVTSNGLEGYADLQFEGCCMGRLSYAGSSGSADDALALLGQEAKEFVDEWHVKAAAVEAELAEA